MIVDAENFKPSPVSSGMPVLLTKNGTVDKRRKQHKKGQAFLNGSKGQDMMSKPMPNMGHVQEAFKQIRGAAKAKSVIEKST